MTDIREQLQAGLELDEVAAQSLRDKLSRADGQAGMRRIRQIAHERRRELARLAAAVGLAVVAINVATPVAQAASESRSVTASSAWREPAQTGTRAIAHPRRAHISRARSEHEDAPALDEGSARLAGILGYQPPGVSVADLKRFIEFSFLTQASQPYRQVDPLDDGLDRGLPIPVTAQQALNRALGRVDSRLAHADSTSELDSGTGPDRLEQVACDALDGGDSASYRHYVLAAIEQGQSVDERSMLRVLCASLGEYSPAHRQAWLERIEAFEAGQDAGAYAPSSTDQAIADYRLAAGSGDSQLLDAARARIVEGYLSRVLDVASVQRSLDARAMDDPELPRRVSVSHPGSPRVAAGKHLG